MFSDKIHIYNSQKPKKFLLTLCFVFGLSIYSFSQLNSIHMPSMDLPTQFVSNVIGLNVGYRGFSNSIFELGISSTGWAGHGFAGFEFSFLNNLKQNEENLSGFSLGHYWGFLFFEPGINATVYSDFKRSNLYLRPYLGFGIGGVITIGYGYNISIGKNRFKEFMNPHEIRIIGRIPMKKENHLFPSNY